LNWAIPPVGALTRHTPLVQAVAFEKIAEAPAITPNVSEAAAAVTLILVYIPFPFKVPTTTQWVQTDRVSRVTDVAL